MRYTMKEIANKVGVSQSTVSRVISGDPRISIKTREKVEEVIKELDFYPNSSARNLVIGKSNTIGIVIDTNEEGQFSNTFFSRSLFAIEKIAKENQYHLLLLNNDYKEDNSQLKKMILENKVDGIILPSNLVTDEVVEVLNESNTSFVIMGEPSKSAKLLNWVDINNRQGSVIAVEFMRNLNLNSLILVIEDECQFYNIRRAEGFKESLLKNGIKGEIVTLKDPNWKREFLLNFRKGETGVICGNNFISSQILRLAKENNFKFIEDIQLISFDNYPLAEYLDPRLTTIDVDTFQLGASAANTLFKLIRGSKNKKPLNKYIENKIYERESTGGIK